MYKEKDPYAVLDPAWGIMPRAEICGEVVGAFDLSHGLDAACVNHAGGAPARIIGVPTVGANYIRFAGGSCLETEIFDSGEVCIVAVSRLPFAPVNGAIIAGTYLSPTDDGTSLYYRSNGKTSFSANTAGALCTVDRDTSATYADWWIHVGSVMPLTGPDRTVVNLRGYDEIFRSTGLTQVDAARQPAARKFRIGDDYSATFRDPVDLGALLLVRGWGETDAPGLVIKDAAAADYAAWSITSGMNPG